MNFKRQLMTAAVAGAFLFAGGAMAGNKSVSKVDDKQIEADYKASKERCDDLSGNAKDVCQLEAKGAEKVAKAELAVREDDSRKTRFNLLMAKAEADYDVAKERCDDLAGNARDVCVKDAKAAFATAKADAKAKREVGEAKSEANEEVKEAREEAAETKRDANYAAAKERCDTYAGDMKARCIADAKARFGVN
jgi:hypothetical protein